MKRKKSMKNSQSILTRILPEQIQLYFYNNCLYMSSNKTARKK
jgi:hypothetical protein